ncbi:Modification methylase BspRI [Poriferisphaera corsica]|uniref:DNA (cytosine-5-)-methyltransferase n=1 Tax=Poriferisphaera corsica TaxID=2528020 RepID=A0A517YVN4_9BACT|nr:DNA cytosine methyltransferase [Poriferisphaera corsica]QDU34297.1 Modification methylase BspRI [Poriferisphaera corsica]
MTARAGATFRDDLFDGLVIDSFAGGGGASTGIEAALGRPVDYSINHDDEAVKMHEWNHPGTTHFCEDIWGVDPRDVAKGRDVGLAWFSPDCKHFSKAKGGKPVSPRVRGLAWVVLRWMTHVEPDVVFLENVEEFEGWGPLDKTGKPCTKRKGHIFNKFIEKIRDRGYEVEWRVLKACDFGAPTIRKRFFMIARRDGKPIVWPEPTHGPGLIPYRTAADIIDFTQPICSIFADQDEANAWAKYHGLHRPKRPLAEKTHARIAAGIDRHIFKDPEPFIVDDAAYTMVQSGYGERKGQAPRALDLNKPLGTIVGTCKHALVAAFIAKHFGGVVGVRADKPFPTITSRGTQNMLVTSQLTHFYGTDQGKAGSMSEPVKTVTSGGQHIGEVRAFLLKYYGNDKHGQSFNEPLHTIPTHERFGMVFVNGEPYHITDISMRMLTPRELYRAQGFPDSYIIGDGSHGESVLTKSAQVRMCGNSVCPVMAEVLVRANCVESEVESELLATA